MLRVSSACKPQGCFSASLYVTKTANSDGVETMWLHNGYGLKSAGERDVWEMYVSQDPVGKGIRVGVYQDY